MQRIVTDTHGNVLDRNVCIAIDQVESRMVISVVGMSEITAKDIRDLLQTKYKVVSVHTDQVIVRGQKVN
jgi:hypothetical protein